MVSDSSGIPLPASAPSRRKQWWLFGSLFISAVALALLNLYAWVETRELPRGIAPEAPASLTYDGSSEKLRETVFVPTLERPVPMGKSAIWCATSTMAWQELEQALGRPLKVEGADEICRELSRAKKADLDPKDYYATGGFGKDGIVERIKRDVAERFPKAQVPTSLNDDHAIGYACLDAALQYEFLFKHSDEPLHFKDSSGRETGVHAFGIRDSDKNGGHQNFREQVLVLFRDKGQYAVDLSRNSKPYQIILARLNRKATLQAALEDLTTKTAAAEPKHLNKSAVLLVPSMSWRTDHRFRELEKALVDIPGGKVDEMYQSIEFRMDRRGARVRASASGIVWLNGHPDDDGPDHFLFDRPFLLVMKKRGSAQPFFVMWVENAELLQRR